MRVAVIGTGIAGNAAAWTLSKQYPVTVYDREIRPGGHSHTVTIDYDGTPTVADNNAVRCPLDRCYRATPPKPVAECRRQFFHVASAAAFHRAPDRAIVLQQACLFSFPMSQSYY
jgi:cation diffusion facilitator CzcD-associated flavoprotein CzcO